MNLNATLRALQILLRRRYGPKATGESGECALTIGPRSTFMTDENCKIVARGPAKVATVLVRRRRKK